MDELTFEESQEQQRVAGRHAEDSSLSRLVIRIGLAKDTRDAQKVLLIIALGMILLTVVLLVMILNQPEPNYDRLLTQ